MLTALMLPSAWALDEEAQAAKEEGMQLWGIHQWEKMQPPLEIAAENGDEVVICVLLKYRFDELQRRVYNSPRIHSSNISIESMQAYTN
ncbi:hypothetical protein ACFIOZ_15360 [Vreelandella sp. F11]|uniref:hypothetical protein n=1 Tax=Vreelandella sp. F11 TaxID=3394751 RepID=UPI0036DF5887